MVFKKLEILISPTRLTLISLGIAVYAVCHMPVYADTTNLYRYVNDDGVKVMDSSIPPKYAQKGYEIISPSGQVIKVVPRAPTAEELKHQQSQNEILFHYERLRKRYSSVKSIESARVRKLGSLETSISILKGNISSLQNQLEAQMSKAASREREGKAVPEILLSQIANSKSELGVAEEKLSTREIEKEEINKKFDRDIEYFKKGELLVQKDRLQKTVNNK